MLLLEFVNWNLHHVLDLVFKNFSDIDSCSTYWSLKMPGGGDTVTIIYPQGCKEVTEDLTPDELIRRLKVCLLFQFFKSFTHAFHSRRL